jgi:imidazolonepropionase-like amidohydrolase
MANTFLSNAVVIDGTGGPAREGALVVFSAENGLLLYAGGKQDCPIPKKDGDNEINLEGYSILPGLFNVHVHLWMCQPLIQTEYDPFGIPYRTLIYYRNYAESLFAGVTTIRCVADSDDIDLAIKKGSLNRMFWGPGIITCGPPLTPYGGHCHRMRGSVLCSGVEEFVKAARIELGKGVDMIKLYYTGRAGEDFIGDARMTPEEASAVCRVVHMWGKKVVAHVGGDEAVNAVIDAGVDCVEHGYILSDETTKKMADRGVFYTPTAVVGDVSEYQGREGGDGFLPKELIDRLLRIHPRHMESLGRAIRNGVKICTGTDSLPSDTIMGSFAVCREMRLLVEAGMKPLEAIRAATGNPALLCGLEKVTGTLKAGLAADLIAVKGRPDLNIADMDHIEMTVKNGITAWSRVPGYVRNEFQPFVPGSPLYGRAQKW